MPRKSIYFPDGLWERVSDAAELDGRSVSGWVAQRLEAALDASGGVQREAARRVLSAYMAGEDLVPVLNALEDAFGFRQRALEAALSEAEGGASPGRSVGSPVSSWEGVRQTASPRASVPASHRGSVSPSLERFKP